MGAQQERAAFRILARRTSLLRMGHRTRRREQRPRGTRDGISERRHGLCPRWGAILDPIRPEPGERRHGQCASCGLGYTMTTISASRRAEPTSGAARVEYREMLAARQARQRLSRRAAPRTSGRSLVFGAASRGRAVDPWANKWASCRGLPREHLEAELGLVREFDDSVTLLERKLP